MTGDKTNAFIEKTFPINFINERARIEAYQRKPVYNIHRWWAKRPGTTFRAMILGCFLNDKINLEEFKKLFYERVDLGGKIVLDPMAGGGTTLIEGLRLNCKVVGIDINPVAWFIMKKELEPVNLEALKEAFKKIEKNVAPKIKNYYTTICPSCGTRADIIYAFWVRKVKCSNCGHEVRLFPSFKLTERKEGKRKIYWVFCPNCGTIFKAYDIKTVCPGCGLSLDISEGYAKFGSYTCPYCGYKGNITKNLKEIPKAEVFALEYFCPVCKRRAYKRADDYDFGLYEKAREDFIKMKDKLLFPRQRIPDGKEVRRLFKYYITHFYHFFNERQLLCLSILLEAILKIENENVREFMLLAFSDCLDFNNMFARYNQKASKIEPMFAHHAFYPKNMPTENNVWGTKFGRCSFVKCFKKLLKGKIYCERPYELRPSTSATKKIYISGDKIRGKIVSSFKDLLENKGNVLLKCQSSENLSDIPDRSIDAIVTDPPYYDNVMYSELADFYYVWLRIALKDKYSFFNSEYCPRTGEIIVNDAQNKGEEYFLQGLTQIFKECKRILKDEGLLVFTFHHRKQEAWAAVLKAVLDSGFNVIAVYPVHSEMQTSFHIHGKKAISYDTIIVCKKSTQRKHPALWNELLDEISAYVHRTVGQLLTHYRTITKDDILVIARGKCLELFSKHYPEVKKDGENVSVLEALQEINSQIIPKLIENLDRKNRKSTSLDQFLT